MLGSGTQPLPQLRPRLAMKRNTLATSYSRDGKGALHQREAALARACQVVSTMDQEEQDRLRVAEKRKGPGRRKQRERSKSSMAAKTAQSAYLPSDMLVAWSASDKTQVIRPKVNCCCFHFPLKLVRALIHCHHSH